MLSHIAHMLSPVELKVYPPLGDDLRDDAPRGGGRGSINNKPILLFIG